jgi:hypothetical protein
MISGWKTERPVTCVYCAEHEREHPEGGWCVVRDGREYYACECHALDAFDSALQSGSA